MNDKKIDRNFEGIKNLISIEEEEALHIFRKNDFQSRLAERIKADRRKESSVFFWLKKPVPAAIVSLFFLSLGVLAVLNLFFLSPHKRNAKNIAKFLQQTPAFQSTMREKVTVFLPDDRYVKLEWSIERVLFSLFHEGLSKKDLSSVLNQVLSKLQAGKQKKATGLLDINKEIEMQKKDKDFIQFFSQILKKIKEV
jgi:hypothetical protein